MIQFEIEKDKQSVEVYLNSAGIDELIRYLNFIKENQGHYHLIIGNELSESLINTNNVIVKHVNLIFLE
jgi:hypothetical protein